MTTTIDDIKDECVAYGHHAPEYFDKMMHAVPVSPVVDRNAYIVRACKGKGIMSLGHSGPLAKIVEASAAWVAGFDLHPENIRVSKIDLDNDPHDLVSGKLRKNMQPELVLMGEILEHLANPGNVLHEVRKYKCPVLITVPNAFCDVGRAHLKHDKRENVNRDHVAYYSYWTLRRLVERYGFEVKEFYWYKGQPMFSEGLIMLVG